SPCGVHLVTQRPPARIVVHADLSCETQLITQSLSCETQLITQSLSCETQLITQSLSCETQLITQSLSCETQLISQSLSCKTQLLTQSLSCETQLISQSLSCKTQLLTQTYPAKHLFTLAGLVAATAVVTETQARRQERDTMTHRSVRTEVLIFFGLGIRLLLYYFGYVSTKEPVAQMVARITVSLISVEAI
ncbi:unnamed protein product, partial [Penicillium nalgiovense]